MRLHLYELFIERTSKLDKINPQKNPELLRGFNLKINTLNHIQAVQHIKSAIVK